MNYPANYAALEPEDLQKTMGGGPLEIFDRVTGYTF